MGSRGRRDAEFQGGKYPILQSNKLVSVVRVVNRSLMRERPERRMTIPVRHRWKDALVTMLTCESSTADIIRHTTSTPCGVCCNLMTKTRGRRTSQKCCRCQSIQSTCHKPEASSLTSSHATSSTRSVPSLQEDTM